ncbi:MAG: salivary glue protein Sgs-3 [Eggerthellaceae bacterium]|nr:salivary glue protein Sgs-3 [Eggerthellaceae bacterium]
MPAEGGEGAPKAPSPQRRRKTAVVIGVVCAVLVVAGAGFWVWHEQPSFCNAICHAPQDPINATYDGVPGQAGLDKWGNPVADMGDLLVVQHKEAGETCLSCHEPTLGQQITEGMHWVSGDFEYPLDERSLDDLNHYLQKDDPASLCLNEGCHNMTRDDLVAATAAMGDRNPHKTFPRHDELSCSDCHKSHRQSVNACSRCHDDVPVPDGWLSADEAAQLNASAFPY